MRGTTHLITGAAVGLAVAQTAYPEGWKTLAAGAGLGGLAALIPDWLQVNIPGGSRFAANIFGHRGITHSLLFAGFAAYVAWLLWRPAFLIVWCAWASHLLLDALSNGAPVFFPLPRLTLARIKTGSWMDRVVGAAALVLLLAQIAVIVRRG